ncbi:hypothetical protein [Treponema sp.]|uniref:hypothetical protein n=1 Tax=Treponema sp. TaxID=166 RepID=UPI003FD7618E
MDTETTIKLRCIFCGSGSFEVPEEGYQPEHGEQILCSNCGRINDYDSLLKVAKKHATEWAEKQVQKEFDDFAKQMRKIFK